MVETYKSNQVVKVTSYCFHKHYIGTCIKDRLPTKHCAAVQKLNLRCPSYNIISVLYDILINHMVM